MLTVDQATAIGTTIVSYLIFRPILKLQSVTIPLVMSLICVGASLAAEWLLSGSDLRGIVTLQRVAAATATGVGIGLSLLILGFERAVRNAVDAARGKSDHPT